ncbi:hypothetical protein TSTA_042880 [Talaromyces stipitatus ATCC 10500]|uniref:Uncharacterized protein n=1 Tax=Talaromyces stipitatus (strain ATCC 10500 / CBS 375.48 / QM 6759 / NRRL 1006) TaxID=441959 RepID=B8MJZ9_TALSN|nr:uncharacterized protein TSTA_042880 [Talaromyces stipitatus ATCC 10500]EED14816.1 hypothetical protein TSTA_042880 [Talaromyces stipitatus ATCC 10500]
MESGVSAALALGAEAVVKLNKLLKDTQTAKSWYGDFYDMFTSNQLCVWNGRQINRVFVVKKEEWVPVIRKCLDDCHRWLPHSNGMLLASYLSGVLALANGANVDYEDSGKGGFVASLDARDFVITIQRDSAATQMTGHLEPRDHPETSCRVISEPKWTNLLWYGHTFEEDDPIMSWPRIDEQGGPPEDLVEEKYHFALCNIVMDDARRKLLAKKLRESIHQCHQAWEQVENENKLRGVEADEVKKIKENLRKKKVILCDERGTDYVLEQTPEDTLDYAKSQRQQADSFGERYKQRDLVGHHKRIYALTRLLTLPKILNKNLSTRSRGINVALA